MNVIELFQGGTEDWAGWAGGCCGWLQAGFAGWAALPGCLPQGSFMSRATAGLGQTTGMPPQAPPVPPLAEEPAAGERCRCCRDTSPPHCLIH